MPDKFSEIRKTFPITKQIVYLNHAGVSPFSTRVAMGLARHVMEQTNYGGTVEPRWTKRVDEARREAARLINADPNEIAFVDNTTQGLNYFARGIAWRRGDNVVLPRIEFPANVYPWLSLKEKGVRIKWVRDRAGRVPVEDIERAIDARTRAVAVSFVEFSSGYRNDLATLGSICSKRDVYFVVDGIQGLGALKLDVKQCRIDGLSAGGHKWLLAPQGTGIFYCSRRVMNELAHPTPGWLSMVGWDNYYQFNYKLWPDARRYEPAQKNLLGIAGLNEALKLINGLGIDAVERRILDITDHLCRLLEDRGFKVYSPRGEGEKSGIVCFTPRKYSAEKSCAILLKRGFLTVPRQGNIRVSPHLYNTRKEMERLVEALP
ncbi:MAG TPA: aminotransferase class V-fold PLP-dependent enzyme [bacterium]|nr:aminotransferase class V-fold PLP-dependent enzyme [bacterium]